MRKYDETTLKVAERVLQKSDEIIRQRQIKATKIRHISVAVSGFCAGILLCIGVFNFTQYRREHNPDLHNNNQDPTSSTIIENTSTSISTTTVTETANDISVLLTEPTTETETADTDTTPDTEETSEENQTEPSTQTEEEHEEPATEAETTVATEPATVLQPTLCGDVNGDDMIDIEDAVLVINYVNRFSGTSWAEYYKKQGLDPAYAEQALANADAYRPSDKRELTSEDVEAIMGYINGDYPKLPINELES